MIGEPFAEQPYAVAVQQGSHLQEEISKTVLALQKDRYFEGLSGKYWNNTKRTLCPITDDSEGITLRSLGGVFIATLIGLGFAMIVLVYEVYTTNKETQKVGGDSKSNLLFDGTAAGKLFFHSCVQGRFFRQWWAPPCYSEWQGLQDTESKNQGFVFH